jgi:hypothetical protein
VPSVFVTTGEPKNTVGAPGREQWGWGTADAGRALGYLKRFGSVTVLNGRIHQIIRKVEGNVTFHTAASTAFPQPAPGTARAPGPMKEVPADELHKYLGIWTVNYVGGKSAPALIDSTPSLELGNRAKPKAKSLQRTGRGGRLDEAVLSHHFTAIVHYRTRTQCPLHAAWWSYPYWYS